MSEEKNTYIEETLPNGNIDDLPMMKSKKPVAIILVLICISLAIAAGAVSTRIRHSAEMYGEVDWNDILLTVDQPVEGGILVKVNNRSVSNMNFGWVDNATIILETSEGTYIQKIKRTIGNFSTGYILLAFPQASGVPQSLTFDSVGRGLGADSSFGMDLIIHGDGEKSIKPMNVFEIIWAYARWAYYWMISVSDTQGIMLRIFVSLFAIVILVYFFSLLKPRKSVRAKVMKKYMKITRHYQDGAYTGKTILYFVVFQLESGKLKKVNVRTRSKYEELCCAGWGLLTMKGILYVDFDYLPDWKRRYDAFINSYIAEKTNKEEKPSPADTN